MMWMRLPASLRRITRTIGMAAVALALLSVPVSAEPDDHGGPNVQLDLATRAGPFGLWRPMT